MNSKYSQVTKKLLEILDLKIPIIQAPTGGAASDNLIIAVANSGAYSGLPLSWSTIEDAEKRIKNIQSKTSNSFYANFVLNFEPKALEISLDLGVKTIQFSWGMPTLSMVDKIKKANAVLGIQVTGEDSAKAAINLGADYLICQGVEAGGHVHATRSLRNALEHVLKAANNVPVVASGGIADGTTMHNYMSYGAAAVVMGSRFVATQESAAHKKYKQGLVNASADDTVFTVCMNKGWDNATHRILRNETSNTWEAAGCPIIGKRPGEFDVVGKNSQGKPIERYSFSAPLIGTNGDIETMANYAGMSVNEISDIPSVPELIDRILKEFNNC